jgi:hypothetical protein
MATVGRLLSTGILRVSLFDADDFSGTSSNIGITTSGGLFMLLNLLFGRRFLT